MVVTSSMSCMLSRSMCVWLVEIDCCLDDGGGLPIRSDCIPHSDRPLVGSCRELERQRLAHHVLPRQLPDRAVHAHERDPGALIEHHRHAGKIASTTHILDQDCKWRRG